ncbi:unnamed protein product [Prunus armeniaca]
MPLFKLTTFGTTLSMRASQKFATCVGTMDIRKEACSLKTTSAGQTSETPNAVGADAMGQPAEVENENYTEANEGLRGPWMNVPPLKET